MKQLFWQLMQYYRKLYYPGRGIRWILIDDKGRTPYCIFCGNYANGVGLLRIGAAKFCLPICKGHAGEYLERHGVNEFTFPGAFSMTNLTQEIAREAIKKAEG